MSHSTIQESNSSVCDEFHLINVDELYKPTLNLNIVPQHDTIGIQANPISTHFCATVKAQDLPEKEENARAPVDIVVALDVSGSMQSRGKLELCKETLNLLLRELGSEDRFGLVTFSDEATIQISAKKMTVANKELAVSKISNLQTEGCTNLSGGIGLAAQELFAIENPNTVRTIFLLTDGIANRGVYDRDGIIKLTKGCLQTKALAPISIHCFGYGSDHDQLMLREISQATEGGTYYFVKNDSDVSSAFGDALGGILSVVAQNTVLTINVDQQASQLGVRILNVQHEKAIKQMDGSFKVNIGDFYAEESRDVLFEVVLASVMESTKIGLEPIPHASVFISYMDTINKRLVKSEIVTGSIVRQNGSEVSAPNEHVLLQCTRIKTTDVMKEAQELAERGDLDNAKSKINSHIEYLQKESLILGKLNPLLVQMLSELKSILSSLSSRSSYKSSGASYMQARIQTHYRQRCSEASPSSTNIYRSSMKRCKAKKMSSK